MVSLLLALSRGLYDRMKYIRFLEGKGPDLGLLHNLHAHLASIMMPDNPELREMIVGDQMICLPGSISDDGSSFTLTSMRLLEEAQRAILAWSGAVPGQSDGTWEVRVFFQSITLIFIGCG